ncbi:MAG: chemotaxis protein CheC [Clostridiales bacterium]|jgi:chemotaxis protein CheC|nr:chemotaxis protein CheC [Clostridiales bacterium]
MALNDYGDLNEIQLDALREIGNIGSGNAATALSSMLERAVNIAVPKIRVLDYNSVCEQLGGPEKLLVGILFSMSGDVTGMMMFLLHKEFAHMVLNSLVGSEFDGYSELDEMDKSTIQEVGNIMAGSYVNAMAAMTGLTIDISVPTMNVDMAGALLSVPAIYYANISDRIILIEDEFDHDREGASSHILLIPEVDGLMKIMDSLGLGS